MSTSITYVAGSERPALKIAFVDEDGAVINLTGYSGTLKLGLDTTTTALTKTTGITCDTTGMTVAWVAGELALTPGNYTAEAIATNASLDYRRQFSFVITAALA